MLPPESNSLQRALGLRLQSTATIPQEVFNPTVLTVRARVGCFVGCQRVAGWQRGPARRGESHRAIHRHICCSSHTRLIRSELQAASQAHFARARFVHSHRCGRSTTLHGETKRIGRCSMPLQNSLLEREARRPLFGLHLPRRAQFSASDRQASACSVPNFLPRKKIRRSSTVKNRRCSSRGRGFQMAASRVASTCAPYG